ncbi:MAG: AAA family ATPase [Lachnospiraceae bacterium]|nr:AAA family ATPase [Lachnospiraceae bacterium]
MDERVDEIKNEKRLGGYFLEYYITEIVIEELRHLTDIKIKLNRDKRTNMLLTGKNGSGKTTLLRAMKAFLQMICEYNYDEESTLWKMKIEGKDEEKMISFRGENQVSEICKWLGRKIESANYAVLNEINGLHKLYHEGNFLIAFYGADRKIGIKKADGVTNVVLEQFYSVEDEPGKLLHQYLIHLKTQQSYARNEGDMETVRMLEQWFERFTDALRVLLDNQSICLRYNYKNYDFLIVEEGRKPYGFEGLSDGYSAVIQIFTDLILRMERNWLKDGIISTYNMEGIVLIDELETHLHIGLQRNILPFLTRFFPKIQFIVSTHSPYVLNSIENCVIYDLEKNIRMEDMSGYSAEGIVEGYFEYEVYSEILLQKVKRYEALVNKDNPTEEERVERAKILVEMRQLSGDLAKEAKDAFEEIEQRRKQHD